MSPRQEEKGMVERVRCAEPGRQRVWGLRYNPGAPAKTLRVPTPTRPRAPNHLSAAPSLDPHPKRGIGARRSSAGTQGGRGADRGHGTASVEVTVTAVTSSGAAERGWNVGCAEGVGMGREAGGSSIARSPARFRTWAKLSFASVCGTRGRSGVLPKEIQTGNSDGWSGSGSRFL